MSLGDKHDVLKSVFGFDSFRAGQEAIVDRLLAGTNSLAVMPNAMVAQTIRSGSVINAA